MLIDKRKWKKKEGIDLDEMGFSDCGESSWEFIDGEDYGRGFIEEYLGDLRSLEALTQSIVPGSAASAKVLFLVRPNGTTKTANLAKAPNGAFLT